MKQIAGVAPVVARPASDLVESGYSVSDAVGLTVNTLRVIAAGKRGVNYRTRNAAREAVSDFSTQKKNVSAGLRKGIERVEGSKKPLRDEEVAALVEKASHRVALVEGVLMAMDGSTQEPPTRVREAAERLGASGSATEMREALSAAVEADKAVVELFSYAVEEATRKRQPVEDTRVAKIPAPPQRTLGEKLAGQPFDEQKHPRGMGGQFATKGGGASGSRPAGPRGPQRAQQRARAAQGPSPEEVNRLLMEMGWEAGDLAAYQKSVGLKATGEPDLVTIQMLKTQIANREAGPSKETVVLSADQPSKESGRSEVSATAVRRAKSKKRAGKSPKPKESARSKKSKALQEATVINNAMIGGSVTGTPTAWGGATTALLVAGDLGEPVEVFAPVHPLVTELLGIRGQLASVVEARKAAHAAHDTIMFTRMRADESALRERLAEVEADVERLEEVKSSAYPGLERSPKENWVERVGGLPKYIERIAKHLHYEKGKTIGNAIAIAVNVVKKMCATGDLNFPGKQSANPKSRAEACAAVASWEEKKARSKVKEAMDELVEAARGEGEHYYPSVEEVIEIVGAAEAMDFDAYPPLREAPSLTQWDERLHPRNRLGEFTEVLGKLTKGEKVGVWQGTPGRGGMLPATFERRGKHPEQAVVSRRGREMTVHASALKVLPKPKGAQFDEGTGGGGGLAPGYEQKRIRPQRLRGKEAEKPEMIPIQRTTINLRTGKTETTTEYIPEHPLDREKRLAGKKPPAETLAAGEDLKQKPLYEIADMIRKEWPKVNFAAAPYLEAMGGMTSHTENYGLDSGKSIIAYFLSNASGFRGDHAKRIKAELKRRLKESADGVLLAEKLDKLDRAVAEREAAATYNDSAQFVAARAREVALREAVLSAAARKKLPKGAFAIPPDRYPIHDEAHARNALARVSQHGTPEEQKKVRAAVKRRYPNIEIQESVLSGEARKKLPSSAFVFPKEKRYPIHDRAHGANALARASGKPEWSTVKAAVCKRYPDLPACKED